MTSVGLPSKVWGAVYIPTRAYNAYQMWHNYNPAETERDFGYAAGLSLNALRIWLSYEYWLDHPARLEERFRHLLQAAHLHGLKVMPSLFETCGVQPSPEAIRNTDPLTAVSVASPKREIIENVEQWESPRSFVNWFMERFKDDSRLLAIEIMNEPNTIMQHRFARDLLRSAGELRGSVPLTVACVEVDDYTYYMDTAVDILQHHENFPASAEQAARRFEKAAKVSAVLGKPVWVSEWQRIRDPSYGNTDGLADAQWEPSYAELSSVLKAYPLGGFFWSLMIKPAYLPRWRRKGTLNGVFHEDGAVWSIEDARAISGNPGFEAVERKVWPEWCRAIRGI